MSTVNSASVLMACPYLQHINKQQEQLITLSSEFQADPTNLQNLLNLLAVTTFEDSEIVTQKVISEIVQLSSPNERLAYLIEFLDKSLSPVQKLVGTEAILTYIKATAPRFVETILINLCEMRKRESYESTRESLQVIKQYQQLLLTLVPYLGETSSCSETTMCQIQGELLNYMGDGGAPLVIPVEDLPVTAIKKCHDTYIDLTQIRQRMQEISISGQITPELISLNTELQGLFRSDKTLQAILINHTPAIVQKYQCITTTTPTPETVMEYLKLARFMHVVYSADLVMKQVEIKSLPEQYQHALTCNRDYLNSQDSTDIKRDLCNVINKKRQEVLSKASVLGLNPITEPSELIQALDGFSVDFTMMITQFQQTGSLNPDDVSAASAALRKISLEEGAGDPLAGQIVTWAKYLEDLPANFQGTPEDLLSNLITVKNRLDSLSKQSSQCDLLLERFDQLIAQLGSITI